MGYWRSVVIEGKPSGWDKPNCRWQLSPEKDLAVLEVDLSDPDFREMSADPYTSLISWEEAEVLISSWDNPEWHYPNEIEAKRIGYCSVADIRQRGISDEVMDDEKLIQAISDAAIKINRFCNRSFFLKASTFSLDGDGTSVIFMEDWPIHEIYQIKVDDRKVAADAFSIYGEFGYIKLKGCFSKGNKNVEVSGTFGYAKLPDEIRQACILITINELRQIKKGINLDQQISQSTENAIGIKRTKIEDVSVEFEYPSNLKKSSRFSTGVAEADAILFKFKKDITAVAI